MGDTWFVGLKHFLDDEGTIAVPKGPARKLYSRRKVNLDSTTSMSTMSGHSEEGFQFLAIFLDVILEIKVLFLFMDCVEALCPLVTSE